MAVTVWLLLDEVKRNAVSRHTPEQSARYLEWITRAQLTGRAVPIEPVTLAGYNWAVECEDQPEANWLTRWLHEACGFGPTMIRSTRRDPRAR